jgi:hypothetical protein
MPSISFPQAFALSRGVLISPSNLNTFNLTTESNPEIKVSLNTLLSGQSIDLATIPSLPKDGTLNLPNQSYSLVTSQTTVSLGEEVGSIGFAQVVSNENKFITFSGVFDTPEDFNDGTKSYTISGSGSSLNTFPTGTTAKILPETYSINKIEQLLTPIYFSNLNVLVFPGSIKVTIQNNVGFIGKILGLIPAVNLIVGAPESVVSDLAGWRIKINGVTSDTYYNATINITEPIKSNGTTYNDSIALQTWNSTRTYKKGEIVKFIIVPPTGPENEHYYNAIHCLEDGTTSDPGASPFNNTWTTIIGVWDGTVLDGGQKYCGSMYSLQESSTEVSLIIPYGLFREFLIGDNGLESNVPNPMHTPSLLQIEDSGPILNEGTITFEPIIINKQGINYNNLPAEVVIKTTNNSTQTGFVSQLKLIDGSSTDTRLSYKFGSSFDGNEILSDTENFYHITGQKLLKKLK